MPAENDKQAEQSAVIDRRYSARVPRLKRLDRVFADAPIYFVTACTAARKKFLSCVAVHEAFVAFCKIAADRGAWVGCYVIMPDHLHLFVAIDDRSVTLSVWMKSLKNALSKILRREGIQSPHWQKGFFEHVLRAGESYAQKWNYVRDNPVRAGLIASANDWPFSGEIEMLDWHNDPGIRRT